MLERVWRKGNSPTLLVGMQTSTATVENSVEIPLKNWKQNCHMTQQSHCWAYTLSKPEFKETYVLHCSLQHCLQARTWKQPRCPLADEWIRKLWCIYTMEYHSAVKQNSFESVLMRWMKLEPIIQSEVSQKEKHRYSILTHIYGI